MRRPYGAGIVALTRRPPMVPAIVATARLPVVVHSASIVPAAAPWRVRWAEACHERAADCAVPETKRSRVHATPERSALVMLRAVPAENVPPRKPLPDDNVNSYARAKTSAAASVAAAAARKSAVVPWLPAAGVAGIT